MARDNLFSYPDFNEAFKIHTDASAFQLGVVISQKYTPISFYSINVTDPQQQSIVKERELLIIVETLKEL